MVASMESLCRAQFLLLSVVCMSCLVQRGSSQMMGCQLPNCTCLQPVGTFCNDPVQDLSGFNLPTIQPGSFSQAGFVTNLSLVNNGIMSVQNTTFEGLTNILSLDLSSNQLSDLPDGLFSFMPSLLSLDLRRNSLTSLNPEAFRGLDNLQILNIQSNQLSIFSTSDLLPLLPSLTTIHISGNLYDCSSPLVDQLISLLNRPSLNVVDRTFVFCSNGTSVLDLLPTPTTTSMTRTPSSSLATSVGVAGSLQASTFVAVTTSSLLPSPTISSVVSHSPSPTLASLLLTSSPVAVTSISASSVKLLPSTSSALPATITITSSTSSAQEGSSTTTLLSSTAALTTIPSSSSPPTPTLAPTSTPSPSSTPAPSPSLTPAPSPPPTLPSTPDYCPEETTLTHAGYLVWAETASGDRASHLCPNGPSDAFAQRLCMASGVWSADVRDERCTDGSTTEQLLATISSSEVTEANSEELSLQLASLSPEEPLTLQELDTVTSLAAELVMAGAGDIQVLNNTLQALDNALESSSSSLSEPQGAELSSRLRAVVDTLLLDALSINQTQLVLSFSHLAVGGAYISATNSTHLLASIRVLMNGSVVIDVGSEEGDVVVEAEGNSTVQVTVYEGDDLFTGSQCPALATPSPSNTTVRGEVVTPIITVTTEDPESEGEGEEEVIITYSRAPYGLTEGERYVCARWNSSVNCGGGGWTIEDCSLAVTPSGSYQCKCLHQGTFTLLDIPADTVPPLENIPLISRVIFYVLSTASIPFYLTIIITILVTRELRVLPVMQCLLNQSLSQGLTLLVLALSFERDEISGVCFVLGALLQYLYLVSLSWLVVHPVFVCVRIFKRLLYEKEWLIAPFAVICWVWPALPVAVYGGLRYERITQNTTFEFICWVESSLFPNTLTYLTAVIVTCVLVTALTCLVCLYCSDYTIETSTYLRIASNLPNLALLLGVVLSQYFTAAAASFNANPDYILLSVGGFSLLCGCYFFLANAMFRSKIRNPLFCREDPVTRSKMAGYSTGHRSPRPTPEESVGSSLSTPEPFHPKYPRKADKTTTVDSSLDYVGSYLGPQQQYGGLQGRRVGATNPIPLSLFGQVPQGAGRVRRSGEVTGLGANPAYRLDLSSDV